MLQTKQLEHRASKSFGRKRMSCLLKSAKVSDLLWVLLPSCNNPPFLQSCGDGAVAVFMLFSWCEMLYECWGSLLEFSLLAKGLILRSDLGLAQEEGRQRILFCRKLGQQVFIIVLDSPMWFAFRNELGWHRGWSLSPSQDAASNTTPYLTAFPNGILSWRSSGHCELVSYLFRAVCQECSGTQGEVQDVLERKNNSAGIFSVTEVHRNHRGFHCFYTPSTADCSDSLWHCLVFVWIWSDSDLGPPSINLE